ncbi:MAG: hypothetical protein QG670_1573 [Thermoproteota archaeon]|nr:hypothetical protein [Thermoproteota archaeon]
MSETAVLVKDIMTSPVVKVLENDSVELVAKLMASNDLGSIIVTDKNGKPVGIITERDIVKRVAAKSLLSEIVKAEEVMSSPLITVNPEVDIKEAAKMMSLHGIRRLVVMDAGNMIGLVSSKDIVVITPALIEIITEKARITQGPLTRTGFISAGYCDKCRQWSESLMEVDGRFICEECRIDLEEEEKEL